MTASNKRVSKKSVRKIIKKKKVIRKKIIKPKKVIPSANTSASTSTRTRVNITAAPGLLKDSNIVRSNLQMQEQQQLRNQMLSQSRQQNAIADRTAEIQRQYNAIIAEDARLKELESDERTKKEALEKLRIQYGMTGNEKKIEQDANDRIQQFKKEKNELKTHREIIRSNINKAIKEFKKLTGRKLKIKPIELSENERTNFGVFSKQMQNEKPLETKEYEKLVEELIKAQNTAKSKAKDLYYEWLDELKTFLKSTVKDFDNSSDIENKRWYEIYKVLYPNGDRTEKSRAKALSEEVFNALNDDDKRWNINNIKKLGEIFKNNKGFESVLKNLEKSHKATEKVDIDLLMKINHGDIVDQIADAEEELENYLQGQYAKRVLIAEDTKEYINKYIKPEISKANDDLKRVTIGHDDKVRELQENIERTEQSVQDIESEIKKQEFITELESKAKKVGKEYDRFVRPYITDLAYAYGNYIENPSPETAEKLQTSSNEYNRILTYPLQKDVKPEPEKDQTQKDQTQKDQNEKDQNEKDQTQKDE